MAFTGNVIGVHIQVPNLTYHIGNAGVGGAQLSLFSQVILMDTDFDNLGLHESLKVEAKAFWGSFVSSIHR